MEQSPKSIFEGMRRFFATGATLNHDYRKKYLRKLRDAIKSNEQLIVEALHADLRKSPEEAYMTEVSVVLAEIRGQLRHMTRWARTRCVATPLSLFPSTSRTIRQPKGVVLVLSPWNYPFQLALDPLVGALAAGNCVVLKPSTTSAATCAVIRKIITEVFPPEYVSVFDGDHDQTAQLLSMRFDHIFFTGGASFGATVMAYAAKNLVPVTLELGGKSPCIVDSTADVELAARKIIWGKLINAGQTCVAPDYVLVHESLKEQLIESMVASVWKFYGRDVRNAESYPRIISDKAFRRLAGYIDAAAGRIVYGGEYDASDRYVAPTIIDEPDLQSPLMQEEIFGPILPVIAFKRREEAVEFVNSRERPLALYYFGNRRDGLQLLEQTTSGGACINDTIIHVANPHLPFGGVGFSGMGRYHYRWSFDTFSNIKGTVVSARSRELKFRYPPYTHRNFSIIKRLI